MVRLRRLALAVVVVTAALAASRCYADKLKLGDPAPQWSKIPGVDGKEHSLSDYRDAKLIVIVFTCNHCPVAVAYEDRLVALQKDYQDKGVQLIAINVNNLPADRLDKMKERAQEKGFNFPYLYDSGQNTGREYAPRIRRTCSCSIRTGIWSIAVESTTIFRSLRQSRRRIFAMPSIPSWPARSWPRPTHRIRAAASSGIRSDGARGFPANNSPGGDRAEPFVVRGGRSFGVRRRL